MANERTMDSDPTRSDISRASILMGASLGVTATESLRIADVVLEIQGRPSLHPYERVDALALNAPYEATN
jgi:hypothetical protein